MEQPRYRAGPGGGSGTAWSGTCGATGATGATEATRATGATGATRATGLGMAGDDEDESGECNMGVPKPRTVPKPEGVPSFGGVPSPEGVPNSGSVPSPGDVTDLRSVPNSGIVSSPSSVTNARGVPNPGGVPKPGSVPNSGSVPKPGSVPSLEDVPNFRDVPNPEGVSNSGSVSSPSSVTDSRSVPNSGSVSSPSSVPNTRSVPTPGSVTSPGGVPKPGSVPKPRDVPSPRDAPNPVNVPNPEGIPKPGSVPNPGNAPNPRSVPSLEGVPNPGGVSSPGSVPKLGGVPNPSSVPNPANVPTVPTPGGRCSCRGPPASPPSPSRDLPCGLGCRHRPNPGDPGHKTPPNHHEEQKNTPNDTTRGHLRSLRAVTRAGIALSLRLLGALLALLFLLLLLLLGALRSFSRRVSSGFRHFQELLSSLRHPQSRPDVPKGGDNEEEEEVTRLVAMAGVAEEELDPFRVLGVEPTASDPELRRAYRRLAVLVHPDKSRDPRAEAAFKVLRAGWERVSSPERRRQYQTKQLAQGELARALSTFLGRLQEELRDAMDAMGCTRCGGRHRRFQLDRDPRGARYCGPCGGWHSAEEGDLWAESSLMGLKVTYLARMDGHIYDVTEWAGCQRVAISPDSHRVPYHLSFGARTATPAGRQRAPPKGSPPSPTELQDFLARVFQGNPGPGEPPGGAFPTPPGAAGPPQGPPQGQGGPPRGDTKHKRRKKGRRPLPR